MNVIRDIRQRAAIGRGETLADDLQARRDAIAEAVAALTPSPAAGGTALVPSECGYLLVTAGAEGGGDRLLGDTDEAEDGLGAITSGIQRKLVRRLLPGPCVFRRRVDGSDQWAGVRMPRHDVCRALIAAWRSAHGNEAPLFARELTDPSDAGRPIREALAAVAAAEKLGIPVAVTLDDGTSTLTEPATVLELPGGAEAGGPIYRVLRTGAYEQRYIAKMAERTILFVCTGNTCRSPMAAAIAEHLLAHDPAILGATTTHIVSAGTAAGTGGAGGGGATPEGLEALEQIGINPPAVPHRARQLTRQLIDEADVIWTMTRSHLLAVRRLDGGTVAGAEKAELLDPDGEDVPDPAGMSLGVYRQTAQRLRELIERRFKEMDA